MFALYITIFALAIFLGFEVITKVPPTLHTPLMSGANAISGITIVGALIVAGQNPFGEGSALPGVISPPSVSIDMEDDIISGTLETDGGEIIHPFAREVFGLPKRETAAATAASEGSDA